VEYPLYAPGREICAMAGSEAQINNQMTIKITILDLNSDIVLPEKSDSIGSCEDAA
jgi:hypothetical protein